MSEQPKEPTFDEQVIEWERMEEQDAFRDACRVANKNLWRCDDEV